MYVKQPPGYVDADHLEYVCRLCKALYGLKEVPRACHDKIADYLMYISFHMSHGDHSLYVCKSDVGIVLITIYVDELIIVGGSENFLGIEVIRTIEGIWLSQRHYALDMLSKYGVTFP